MALLLASRALLESHSKRLIPMPPRDVGNRPARAGDLAVAACTLDPVTNQCSYIAPGDLTLLNSPTLPRASPSQIKLLVILADAPVCNSPMETTLANIQTAYLGPNLDGQGGTAKMLENCSYGLKTIVPSAFQAIRVPITTASQCWNLTTCVYQDFWNVLSTLARAQIGNATFDSFNYYSMVFKADQCTWIGLATVGANLMWNKAWILGTWPGMQEVIHNYALWHNQNATGAEYKDTSSVMGNGAACPGAAEMAWLGWASPAVGAGALNSAAMPSGRPTVTWNLPATYLTGVGNYIRVVPDWVPTYTSNLNLANTDPAVSRNVYLHVRVPGNADVGIDPQHAYKDNNMAAYTSPNRRIGYLTSIPVGTRAVVAKHLLVVYTGPSFIGSQGAILPPAASEPAAIPSAQPAAAQPAAISPTAPAAAQPAAEPTPSSAGNSGKKGGRRTRRTLQ
ncbi:hypothetical protein HYH03_000352 [Edaphochlamys debaryana]|uniref:Peptidase M11 gametolysin domain-containing protein n=1 Tax=Edaphochlamys debaryana TaxID=47281 RepID=A0A835YHF2_9CHLO|nr:hypothetical protein HYH03_000352 [Edaphochlamys debaryana]|eukprot:KAG2501854.1 hypothetical protein HYH03_000352 [Edaphochlamys debaryana]